MSGFSADLKQVCGCSWAATGSTTDDVVSKTKKHAWDTHKMKEVPAEIAQKLHDAMRPTI